MELEELQFFVYSSIQWKYNMKIDESSIHVWGTVYVNVG